MRQDRTLGFRILGSLEVELNGSPLSISPQGKRVLATLLVPLVESRPLASMSADQLLRQAWTPGTKQGTGSVRVAVSQLRDHLDPDRADGEDSVIARGGYRLLAPQWSIDACRFRVLHDEGRKAFHAGDFNRAEVRLTSALGLWHGEPFEDPELWDEAAADLKRALETEHRAARVTLAEARSLAGRDRDWTSEFDRLLGEEPLNERVRCLCALAHYRAGAQVRANSIVREGNNLLVARGLKSAALQELLRKMLVSAPELTLPRIPLPGPVEPPPAPSAPLSERTAELAMVINYMQDNWDTRTVAPRCQVNGQEGVGKTNIALAAAQRLKEWFPDGVVLVNMHGTREHEKSAYGAMGDILRSLSLPVPGDKSKRAGLLERTAEDRRTLVIVDGAADAGKTCELLKACGRFAVLVTSRSRLDVADLPSVTIEALSRPAAAQYLEARLASSGQIRETGVADGLTRIAELAERTPQALDITAASVAARPGQPLSQRIERWERQASLADGQREASLRLQPSVMTSYRDLDELPQRAFRLLGLVDSPVVTGWIAASLLDCPLEEAEQALHALASARLLQAEPGRANQQRYHRHARIHATAQQLATREHEWGSALERCLRSHLWMARRARAALDPDVDPFPWQPGWASLSQQTSSLAADPLAWFDDEHGAMTSAVRSGHRAGLWDLTWKLTRELVPFFDITGRADDWEETHRLAAEAAWHAEDPIGEAWSLCGLGLLRRYQGSAKQAEEAYGRAMRLFAVDDDQLGLATARCGLADISIGNERYDRAIEEFQKALDAFADLGKEGGKAVAMAGLGEAHGQRAVNTASGDARQDLLTAVHWSERSFELASQLGDQRMRVSALRDIGVARRILWEMDGDQQDLRRASEAFTECADEYERQGDNLGLARTLVSQGLLRTVQGQAAAARQDYQVAARFFAAAHDYRWVANAYRQLGSNWLGEDEPGQAVNAYTKGVAALERTEFLGELGRCLVQRGWAYLAAGDHLAAEADGQRALSLGRDIPDPPLIEETTALLRDLGLRPPP